MSMILLALAALALSAVPIVLLGIGDPKRRRAAGAKDVSASGQRWLLVIAACLPGLACALLGDSAAFIMWLGGSALLGWSVAAYFSTKLKAE
ncbi:hypothetical protein TPR58_18475 [Sphingomonas sp. HF-S3]|uniref:DUF3325 domain-containing protein n=1 Tax=Sphingomonas rustica TaxID=3103142 RepID=A0ABV0BEE3_9SPHN